mgnify:CR=1 FL=1
MMRPWESLIRFVYHGVETREYKKAAGRGSPVWEPVTSMCHTITRHKPKTWAKGEGYSEYEEQDNKWDYKGTG